MSNARDAAAPGMKSSRAKEIFVAAIEHPMAERADYLDHACAGDPELRACVDSLLRFHEEPTMSLTESALSGAMPMPERVGGYRLLQQIGEGGMGTVYLAEQEKPVRRRVALKLVKLGMDTRDVLRRFEAERQALALMNHPNVAAVYDAGATEGGRPYFVMEYIPGEPITKYCDRHRLTIRERLVLFSQVCRAVQHAHQKGVIHRDIKPSNVLVLPGEPSGGATPMPHERVAESASATAKVIDFGVARATNQRLTEQTVFTRMGQLIGTPEYMSPEQAEMSALDVDTRTDIYSLGAVLYELLTGSLPFDPRALRSKGYAEIQRIIRETEPQRPSTRLSSASAAATAGRGSEPGSSAEIASCRRSDSKSLIRHIRGDLDWIVMKCLEKDRSRRYESADALAAEIRRFLAYEPVAAGPPGVGYRLRKLVRRNRVALAAGAVVVVILITGMTTTLVMYFRAERQRDIAEANEARANANIERARATDTFFEEMLTSVGTAGENAKVVAMLDQAAAEVESGSLKDRPAVEASIRSSLGKSYTALGLHEQALPHLSRALEIREGLFGHGHEEVADSLLSLAGHWNTRRQGDRAEPLARRALQVYEATAADRLKRANARCELAVAQILQGELDSGLRSLESVISDAPGEDRESRVLRYTARHYMAWVFADRSQPAKAAAFQREVLRDLRALYGDKPHAHVATTLNNLGRDLLAAGEYPAAEPVLREALAMRKALWPGGHAEVEQSHGLLVEVMYQFEERTAECERLAREWVELAKRHAPEQRTKALQTLGLVVQRCAPAEAVVIYRELANVLRETREPELPLVLRSIGFVLGGLNDEAGAMEAFREAVEFRRAMPGAESAELRHDLTWLANTTKRMGDFAGAERLFRELLDLARQADTPDPENIASPIAWLSECLIGQGTPEKLAQAESLLRECIAIRGKDLAPDHWLHSATRSLLGAAIAGQGRFAEAEMLLVPAAEAIAPPPEAVEYRGLALRRVAELYERWHAAEPASGYDAKVTEWRARLDEACTATQPATSATAGGLTKGE